MRRKIFYFFASCFLIFSFSYFLINSWYEGAIIGLHTEKLAKYLERIREDISFDNGIFNLEKYNADPLTPVPNQSGTFPLYIITTEGFIIERSQPIAGFLDVSDYQYWLAFLEPRTIMTATNEQWRLQAKRIASAEGQTLGIVAAGIFLPNSLVSSEEIDQILEQNLSDLVAQISIRNGSLDLTKIDIRNTHLQVAFEIISKQNYVLLNNGRIPSFIDVSYVSAQLGHLGQQRVLDQKNKI